MQHYSSIFKIIHQNLTDVPVLFSNTVILVCDVKPQIANEYTHNIFRWEDTKSLQGDVQREHFH